MSNYTHPSETRVLPVRLTQIRPEIRYRAAQQIAERDPADGAEVLYAALYPSDTTYWVRLDAWASLRTLLRSVAA